MIQKNFHSRIIIKLKLSSQCRLVYEFYRATEKGKQSQNDSQCEYLVSNFNEQGENNDDEQIVNDSNSSDDDVDDLQCKITDVSEIQRLR